MKDSDILKQAKLELPKCSGICGAITKAVDNLSTDKTYAELEFKGRSLKHWIRSMLKGHSWLSGWLLAQGHTSKDMPGYCSVEFWQKMVATRQAWLDWMIEQCEKAEQDEDNN